MNGVRGRWIALAGCSLALLIAAAEAIPGITVGAPQSTVPPARAPLPLAQNAPVPVPLTNGWRYLADPGNVGLAMDWAHGGAAKLAWSQVTVPHVFNPVVANTTDRGTVGWYKLQFTGPPAADGRSWNVRFEEVRQVADVWLNGRKLGSNSDPYAPFSLPAASLNPGRLNMLVVRVDSRRPPGSFPEDWWNWGGIVRPVELEPVGRIALQDLGVMPELDCNFRCGDLLIQGTVKNLATIALRPLIVVKTRSPTGLALTFSHSVSLIAPGASLPVSFRVPVHGPPDLWSPAQPSLYQTDIATSAQNRIEQADSRRVGMRSMRVRGGILYLNGKRVWLHGTSIHEDMPGRGAALTDGDVNTIVAELRSVGANITRAHYLLNERLLDALDAAGIMVWSQPPVDHADPILQTAAGRAKALDRLRGTIIGERSHASVVIDSVANELSPTPDSTPGTRSYLVQAIALARRLDPTRPIALDTYCYPGFPAQRMNSKVDVLGISHYFGWYTGLPGHPITDFNQLSPFLRQAHARYPNQALVVAEYGAEGLFQGPVTTKGTYDFQKDYLQRTLGVLNQLPFMNGAIYWTLREFAVNPGWVGGAELPPDDPPNGLHHKGLIAYDGTEKPAYATAQQLFAELPAYVH
jgi:beta-glucuronidase